MQYKKLLDVCDFQGGSQPPKREWSSMPKEGYVRMLQIRDFTQSRSFEIEYVKLTKSIKQCKEDDILIGRYGASVGKILTGLEGAYNVAIMKSIPNEDILNKKYIYYYFNSSYFQSSLLLFSDGRAAQAGFSKDDLSSLSLPVPSLSTQSRIVSELDLLTSLIDNQKKQLDELSKLQQSTFYSMFGDPVENEKEWPVKKLGEVCEFKNGINFNKVDNGGNEYTFLGVSDFKDNVCIYSEQLGVINIEEKITDDYFLENNDIVFVRSNGSKDLVGRAVLIKVGNEKVTYSGFCIRCRIVSDINSLFLIWLLKYPTIKDCLTNAGRGCNISNVNQKVLNNLLIPLPPLPLQTAFAEKISAIEEMKKKLKASIAETQKLFDARMQEIFG